MWMNCYNKLYEFTVSLHANVICKMMKWQTCALMPAFVKYTPHFQARCWSVTKCLFIPGNMKAARKKQQGKIIMAHIFFIQFIKKRQILWTPLHKGLHIHLLFYIHWRPLELLPSYWRAAMLFYECIIGEWACSLCCGCTPAVNLRSNTNTTRRDKERVAVSL